MQSSKEKSIKRAAGQPALHLSDQVAASAAVDKTLDGSALWVLLAIYRAFAILDRDQAEEVAAMGLTPLQFNILTTLQRTRQPTTMGTLASMLVVKPNNLSGNISALAEKGLIRRELNSADQRSLLAVLTPDGEAFLKEHLPAHWLRLERLMGGLTREQRLQMVMLLKQLTTSIQEEQERESEREIDVEKKVPARPRGRALEVT
ncbi:MarR family transcriptional regulator [Ramlibacter sp. AW1]|uniref:MarR family transcriptional regulator n=1 Tax=Ramlibacter aurantiacus TaxID=2801330 RepID=A0A936ZTU1_9BURK|nr:MarR family transcriptional regulator [Ramlibacter aurantiacus]MBL0422441.1 MarR family transcriptional regulator [Ramlibacter aurantiacus]